MNKLLHYSRQCPHRCCFLRIRWRISTVGSSLVLPTSPKVFLPSGTRDPTLYMVPWAPMSPVHTHSTSRSVLSAFARFTLVNNRHANIPRYMRNNRPHLTVVSVSWYLRLPERPILPFSIQYNANKRAHVFVFARIFNNIAYPLPIVICFLFVIMPCSRIMRQ